MMEAMTSLSGLDFMRAIARSRVRAWTMTLAISES